MATSVATVTVTASQTDVTERHFVVFGTIAIAAGDYATGGLTVSLVSSLVNASWLPTWVDIKSAATGYQYRYAAGTTMANGKMKVFVQDGTTGPLAELAAAASPAGLVADDGIVFRAEFTKSRVN